MNLNVKYRVFTVNNVFIIIVKLPSENYSNGWMQLYQTIEETNLTLLDVDYTTYTMSRFGEEITQLEGRKYPIKNFVKP